MPNQPLGQRSIAILYDVAYPFVEGGGQRRLFEIAWRLIRRGWQVDWYALKTWNGEDIRKEHGISYHGLPGDALLYNSSGKRSISEAYAYGLAIWRARVDFAHYDILWCGQWPYFHLFALMARLIPFRTRMVVDWWEIWGSHWLSYDKLLGLGGWLVEFALANIVSRIGRVVTISMQGRRQMMSYGAPGRALTYVPNGLSVEAFAAEPVAHGNSDIIYFGRLKNHKNVDHLILALALLQRHEDLKLNCDIVGDGPERGRLESLASSLGVRDQVRFHGSVSNRNLIGLLKRARIFVHPSTKEGGGSISLLEANACGLPIVFYDHPLGIDPDQVRIGETGIMVSPVAPDALARGIVEMLRQCETRDIRSACIAYAGSFDWDRIAMQYEDIFMELLPQAAGRGGSIRKVA